nr:hypothetical protein [Tanacetum cinerariifolium]
MLHFLSSGKVTFIGATTEKDYHMIVQDDSELNGYFTRIYVPETSQKDSIDILKGQLPLKAINLLDRACAMVRQEFSGEVDDVARLQFDIIVLQSELDSLEDLEETRRPELMEVINMKKTKLDLLQKNCKKEKQKISDIHAMKHLKRISHQLDTHDMDPTHKAKRAKLLEGYAAIIPKVESELCGFAKMTLTVGEEYVARVLSELTGIPSSTFGKNAMEKVKSLKDWLHSQVIGQEEAVTAVCEIVKRTLDEDNMKPGSLLFTGTTVVGKTEMAKALTEHLFGDQSCMIRFDMNELSQSNTVTRFFGPRPGYKGHNEGGQLLQAVRKKPFCVLLLDEFDKACTEIHQSLLRVLDVGHMTDCHGSADLKNAVIIMTSNVGATHLMNSISEKDSFASASKRVIAEVKHRFSNELIARVGEIVVFNPMSNELVEKIIVKEIKKRKAEFATRGVLLKVTLEAKDYIVNQGFKVGSGVQVVKAWIEKHVDRVLKDYFLEEVIDKSSSVEVSVKET